MKKSADLRPGILRLGFIAVLFWFSPDYPVAQQVDTGELGQGQSSSIIFINYEGPYARIETRGQIRNIGYVPGTTIRGGAPRTGGLARYFVIHSISGPEGNKLDADIFGLGIDAGVDHIRNLRLIIQGYLEGAYAYSAQDAALLAEYITIYNAVFRGNWDYFDGRYKTPVTWNLERDKAGLSIRFDEWPGRTLMLIPLALGSAGSLSAVDTSSLSSPEVVNEMRKEDDRGLDSRREMVDFKEREADEAEQRTALQREAIAEEENRLAGDREEAVRKQEDISRGREEVAQEWEDIAREREKIKADEDAGRTTAEEARRREEEADRREAEADKKGQELTKQEAEADKQEEELDKREEALAEKREEAEKTEEFAERKAEEARQEREEIAQDQQAIIKGQDNQTPQPAGIIGIRLIDAGSPLGRLVRVDAENGRELKVSALNTVNVRTVISLAGKLFTVAGENKGNGAVRIVEIQPNTLEIAKQGNDDIHPQSLLWVNGGKLYAITSWGGSLYLARFGDDLAREAQSSATVHPYATPAFQGDTVLIQRADGSPMLLSGDDLSERR
ncbi:MAG: hypothetical protein LBB98_01910 [Treponema sp.]|jgi:hypothetical protein|nr:hypothetical protein [Treponema sp.]